MHIKIDTYTKAILFLQVTMVRVKNYSGHEKLYYSCSSQRRRIHRGCQNTGSEMWNSLLRNQVNDGVPPHLLGGARNVHLDVELQLLCSI